LPYKVDVEITEAEGNRGNVMVNWTKGSPGSANVTALTPAGGIDFYKKMTVKYGDVPIFTGIVQQYDTWDETKQVKKPDGNTETVTESWSNIQMVDGWKLINNARLTANLWLTLHDGMSGWDTSVIPPSWQDDYGPTYFSSGDYWQAAGGVEAFIEWAFEQCGLTAPICYLYGGFQFYDGENWIHRYFANPTLGELINFVCSLMGAGFYVNSAGDYIFGVDSATNNLGDAFKLIKSGKTCIRDSFDGPERVADTATYEGKLSQCGVPGVGGTIHSVQVSLFNKIEMANNRWGSLVLSDDGTVTVTTVSA
jgi:hypothetical protein